MTRSPDVGQQPVGAHVAAGVDWSAQCCGVHQAPIEQTLGLMPDLRHILASFPDNAAQFTFDVKVHMLMPKQYPCIPDWHRDFVPRVGGIQHPELASGAPMYIWVSGPPLTEFRGGFIKPREWVRFSAKDEHRGVASGDFCWRGMIRAVHRSVLPPRGGDWLRRHCQVYLDAKDYNW